MPIIAQGGTGGTGAYENGGAGGDAGQAGQSSSAGINPGGAAGTAPSGNGGNGGAALATGGGGGGGGANGTTASPTGGAGGAGGAAIADAGTINGSGGGGGGGGGIGQVVTTATVNASTSQGGAGGIGGAGGAGAINHNVGAGGGGGGGGNGAVLDGTAVTFTNAATGQLLGGSGGKGGAGSTASGGNGGSGGSGSNGGYGLYAGDGNAITNFGLVRGGAAGVGGLGGGGTGLNGATGAYGTGIVGSDLTIINAGVIAGGFDGSGISHVNAIDFTGGSNVLSLSASGTVGSINGNIAVGGSLDVRSGGSAASLSGGLLVYKNASTSVTLEGGVTLDDSVSGFVAGDTLDLKGVDYSGGLEAVFTASATGGTLQVVDSTHPGVTLASVTVNGAPTSGVFTLGADSAGGTAIGFAAAPITGVAPGDIVVSAIPGSSAIAMIDHVANGLFAGSRLIYTAVPPGASYSSFETDSDFAGSSTGAKFFTANITGQSYTGEEADTDAAGNATRVLLTGYTGQPYQSLEFDYAGGAYTGYKSFATGITGQSYTGLEEDVTAAGQLTKVVYTGLTTTPYSTLEQDYTSGALTSNTFTFNTPASQSYSSYSVTENAAGAQISETVNNTDGSHIIVGSAPNLILEAIGNDKMKGGGSGETFDFSTVFGHDTITDFAGHTTGTGHDTISLSSADFTSFAALSTGAQNVTGGVAFTGKSGSTITLTGLDKTALANLGADFTFHA